MALADRVLLAGVVLALAVPGCTVFNGKTLPEDAHVTPDGGSGVASGTSCACPATASVCETFETAPSQIWSTLGEAPTADTSLHHCGAASLRFHTPSIAVGGDAESGLVQTETFADPKLAQGFYARAWVYVPRGATIAPGNTISLLEIQQAGDPFLGIATQIGSSSLAISDWAATPNEFHETDAPIAQGQWTCLEWQVAADPTNGASQLWVDGNQTTAGFAGKTTTATPPFSRFLVALFFSAVPAAQPAFDLWIDDLAIGPNRLGCGD
jgi:hypothetical protein